MAFCLSSGIRETHSESNSSLIMVLRLAYMVSLIYLTSGLKLCLLLESPQEHRRIPIPIMIKPLELNVFPFKFKLLT